MKSIKPHIFKEKLESEIGNPETLFINVCTFEEYEEKHIEGVINIPLHTLEEKLEFLKDKKTIYIHCLSGARGYKAVEKLKKLGIKADIFNVEGGIIDWERNGFKTKSLLNL